MAKGDLTHGVASASKDPVGAGASRPSSADQGHLEINFATTISPPPSSLTSTPGRSNHRPTVRRGESTVTEGTLRQRRLRGSCDACTRRKKKCDGDGVRRCRCCVCFTIWQVFRGGAWEVSSSKVPSVNLGTIISYDL